MNVIKSTEMKYTIVYIEDNGKYSAYKRFESDKWYDDSNRKITNRELEKNLEEAFIKKNNK
jgi:hypothetical protein